MVSSVGALERRWLSIANHEIDDAEGLPDGGFAGLELVESLLRRLQMILQGLHSVAYHLLTSVSTLFKQLRSSKDALVSTGAAVSASLNALDLKFST